MYMGTQNWGYSKFGSTFKIFETILIIFPNFGQFKFVVFKCVGARNIMVLKSVDNQISNFVDTLNSMVAIIRYRYLEMLLHKV